MSHDPRAARHRSGPSPDEDGGDPVATFLRRRPARAAGPVLTQPPPPPPVPYRGTDTEDEPGDDRPEAGPHVNADVVADIDRLIAEHTTPPSDPLT